MDAKPAADSRAESTHLMGVADANNRGNIHGGTITPIPPLLAVTPTETRRMREAELRRANRLSEREEIIARRAQEARREARDDA